MVGERLSTELRQEMGGEKGDQGFLQVYLDLSHMNETQIFPHQAF